MAGAAAEVELGQLPPLPEALKVKVKVLIGPQQKAKQAEQKRMDREFNARLDALDLTLGDKRPGVFSERHVPVASSSSSHQAKHKAKLSTPATFEFNRDEYLQTGIFESALIGAGRSATKFGQGLKQLYLQSGAKFGWSSQAEADGYTHKINAETALYDSTPVAHSFTGKAAEFAMDAAIYSCVPAGAGARGVKLVFSSAAAGGVIGGLQPVSDGQWSTRLQNVGVGAVVGGVGAPIVGKVVDIAKPGMVKLFDLTRGKSILPVIQTPCPAAVYSGFSELSKRQAVILAELPETGSSTLLHRTGINVTDLASLTAKTGDEFAMFTLGGRRLVIRGNATTVKIGEQIITLKEQGWRWSAHTHPGIEESTLMVSGRGAERGDRSVLLYLEQEQSLILNSVGKRALFGAEETQWDKINPIIKIKPQQ